MKKVAVLRMRTEGEIDPSQDTPERLEGLIYGLKLSGIKVADEQKLFSCLINHTGLIELVEIMLECFDKVFGARVGEWIKNWGHKFTLECDGEEIMLICNDFNEEQDALTITIFNILFEERLDSKFVTLESEETEIPDDEVFLN